MTPLTYASLCSGIEAAHLALTPLGFNAQWFSDTDPFASALLAHHYLPHILTPVECERLQGFPDNYTQIPYRGKPAEACPDTPRYKALGNAWPVPVIHWIGQRLAHAMSAV